MIYAWNLAWIVPLCFALGFILAALFRVGGENDDFNGPLDLDSGQRVCRVIFDIDCADTVQGGRR